MPRARFVHPDITVDSVFAGFPIPARLFFVYVLTQADDAGNFADDPAELKARLFPHDTDILIPEIIEWMHLFAERTLYVRYTFGERSLYHIKNFAKYQRPDYATAPKYPLHPGQIYKFCYREKGKWVKRTVTEADWNREAYGERTVSVWGEVRLGEVSKTEPKPKPPTPTADPEPGPDVPATGSARPPGNGSGTTPLDYTRQDHWELMSRAQIFGIDYAEVKTVEELTQLIDSVPQSVKRKALGR